jgi:hypothetical protein
VFGRTIMILDATNIAVTEIRPLCAALPDETVWASQPDALDRAAEREAAALDWMEQELGEESANVPTFEQRLTTPTIRGYRYNRVASYKAHERIERHYQARLAGQPSKYTFDQEITTRADRARRELRQQRRKLLLEALEKLQDEWVTLEDAQRLIDARERTLFTHMINGRLRKLHINRRTFVAVADLRTYLRSKVKLTA